MLGFTTSSYVTVASDWVYLRSKTNPSARYRTRQPRHVNTAVYQGLSLTSTASQLESTSFLIQETKRGHSKQVLDG